MGKSVSPPAANYHQPKKSSFFDAFDSFSSPLTKSYSNPNILSFYDSPESSSTNTGRSFDQHRSISPPLNDPYDLATSLGPTSRSTLIQQNVQSQNTNSFFTSGHSNQSSFSINPQPSANSPPSPQSLFTPLNNNSEEQMTSPGSPWVRRRRDYLARLNSPNTSQGNTPIGSPSGSPILGRNNMSQMMDQSATSPPAVVRMPHGPPDNATKGFNRETQETRVLGKLEMLSSQVAAAACDNPQH
jgi:hypothetical protein